MLKPHEASSISIDYPVREERQEPVPIAMQNPLPSWKRTLDVICILLAFPVLVPVGVIIAAFIRIVSPGPIFFRQQRVGTMGKSFMCLKFRTMKVDADTTIHKKH